MYIQIILLSILLPAVLGEVLPDLRFGDSRFDLSPLILQGTYDDIVQVGGGDRHAKHSSHSRKKHNYRRSPGASKSEVAALTSKLLDIIKRYQKPEKTDAGNIAVVSYLHNRPEDERRSGAVDKEVLMHHAVPLKIRLSGLLVPENRQE